MLSDLLPPVPPAPPFQPQELVRALRKQVVVVVTAGWNIMCFDHNLRLMWETTILREMPPHTEIREVAIHISNQTMVKVNPLFRLHRGPLRLYPSP